MGRWSRVWARLLGDDLAARVRDGRQDPLPALEDPRAHVRRAAAWAVGERGDPRALSPLQTARLRECTGNGVLAVAVAEARCGGDAEALRGFLRAREAWRVATPDGWRRPHAVVPLDLVARFDAATSALDPRIPPATRAEVLTRATRGLTQDRATYLAMAHGGARREGHVGLQALGLHGHPDSVHALRAALEAVDVDPGRGFAWRRLAATGLGRIGDPRALPWLCDALEAERRDYEGRPGAGLGVQSPVRADLLLALGELGDPRAVSVLVASLGDEAGTAAGGLWLPALAGLRGVGSVAIPGLRACLADTRGSGRSAAHAVGMLHALGVDVGAWATDPRAAVRATVACARDPGRAEREAPP